MPRRKPQSEYLIPEARPRYAAAYVRMSTEHQQYSTENQLDIIKLYAEQNGYEITKVYTDAGKSGLTLNGRKALQQLFNDVASCSFEYQIVLVYDVSRWGRFQDPDESATYEVRCRQAGVAVEYCAEQFKNDGSPISSILKSVKRMMAGEYSRELSVKVFAGQARLISLGYKQGGQPGYGYRRQLIDQCGHPKAILSKGEMKSIQTDRVVLIPGPEKEQKVVREIFRLFIEEKLKVGAIARLLNEQGVAWCKPTPWNSGRVDSVLKNERYIGNNLWNKTSAKLKQFKRVNPENEWIRAKKAFCPIINDETFFAAREIISRRSTVLSDEQLIDDLKALLARHGYLSAVLINADKLTSSRSLYISRFGTLRRAFDLAGYRSTRDYSYFDADKRLKGRVAICVERVAGVIRSSGASVSVNNDNSLLVINDEILMSVVVIRYKPSRFLKYQWQARLALELNPDLNLVVRMYPGEETVKDYLVIPTGALDRAVLNMKDEDLRELEQYRFDNLDVIGALSRRVTIVGGRNEEPKFK